MIKHKIAPKYSEEFLEATRPSPLSDNRIDKLQNDVLNGNFNKDVSDKVYEDFKSETQSWVENSVLNNIQGLNSFTRQDVIHGCTQFIDTQYMIGAVQTIKDDYRYHQRLNPDIVYSVPGYLRKNIPLIIAMPFPAIGDKRSDMESILGECLIKNIDVHIDGAWITSCRDIDFNFNHPSIKSVGISLSKGLGLGWNRIGVRWTKSSKADAITIMNDFHMNNRALAMIGLHYLRNLPPDYLWNKHSNRYYKVCNDFSLTPTNSIQLALRDGSPVGISPLIRYLENNE